MSQHNFSLGAAFEFICKDEGKMLDDVIGLLCKSTELGI